MGNRYFVGVDGGTQSTKVLIFDMQGNIVSEGSQELRPTISRNPGWVEHPDDDLWDSLVVACNKAMEKFPGKKSEIEAIGLCTIKMCLAFLKEDGTLAEPIMNWMDIRAYQTYEPINPEVRYITTTTGYVTYRLTGEKRDTMANNTPWQTPVDIDTWDYSEDKEFFDSFNMPREMLFDLQMPGTVLGYLTKEAAEAIGMPEGIPIAATANDKAVEALGAGLLQKNIGLISLGTYSPTMVVGDGNLKETTNFWVNLACMPHRYLYESDGVRRGMWMVSWFKQLMGDEVALKAKEKGISAVEFLNQEAANVPPGSEGLMTVPNWLAPSDKLYRKGVMIGFDARHTRAHMYRSILEGIALSCKNNYDRMCNELQINPQRIIVSGGGAGSELIMQIFADVFGVPAYRNVITGAAGLGSAICAAVATGAYDSFEAAVDGMVRIKDVFNPIPENKELYQKMNEEVYKQIVPHADEILKKALPIFG